MIFFPLSLPITQLGPRVKQKKKKNQPPGSNGRGGKLDGHVPPRDIQRGRLDLSLGCSKMQTLAWRKDGGSRLGNLHFDSHYLAVSPVRIKAWYGRRWMMLDFALQLAGRGWRIFPCHTIVERDRRLECSCGKEDCKDAAKHPRIKAWQTQATSDKEKVSAWWKR